MSSDTAAAGIDEGTTGSEKAESPDARSTSDADPEISNVPFDMQLAYAIRGARSIDDIQRLVGSEGKVTERDGNSVTYHWVYERPDGAEDYMLFTIYADGSFGGGILNQELGQITVNSFGGFACDKCRPPIWHCGARPSWVDAADWRCSD